MTLVKLSSSAAQSGRNDNNSSVIIIQYRSIVKRGQFIERPRWLRCEKSVGISVSTLRNGRTVAIYIYIHILETVKIAHRPSVGDLIETCAVLDSACFLALRSRSIRSSYETLADRSAW